MGGWEVKVLLDWPLREGLRTAADGGGGCLPMNFSKIMFFSWSYNQPSAHSSQFHTLCFILTKLWSGFSFSCRPPNSACPPAWASIRKNGTCPLASPGNQLTTVKPFSCQTPLIISPCLPSFPSKDSAYLCLCPLWPYTRKTFYCMILTCLQISEIRAISLLE